MCRAADRCYSQAVTSPLLVRRDHPGSGQVNKQPNVPKCSRVVATTSDNVGDVAIERKIFIECDAQQLEGRIERKQLSADNFFFFSFVLADSQTRVFA
jgi:hypothetical protein